MNQPPMTQSISKTLTALERTTQIRNRRNQNYDFGNNSDEEDGELHVLDNGSPIQTKNNMRDERLLDTGHNRKRIHLAERVPVRGEESQVMSVDCTY